MCSLKTTQRHEWSFRAAKVPIKPLTAQHSFLPYYKNIWFPGVLSSLVACAHAGSGPSNIAQHDSAHHTHKHLSRPGEAIPSIGETTTVSVMMRKQKKTIPHRINAIRKCDSIIKKARMINYTTFPTFFGVKEFNENYIFKI